VLKTCLLKDRPAVVLAEGVQVLHELGDVVLTLSDGVQRLSKGYSQDTPETANSARATPLAANCELREIGPATGR
jgi:hypothetical protein